MLTPSSDSNQQPSWEELRTQMETLGSRLRETEYSVNQATQENKEFAKGFEQSLNEFKAELKGLRADLEFSVRSSKGSTANIEERIENSKERFALLDKRLSLIQTDIDGIRQNDLVRVSEAIKECPTLKGLLEELAKSTSPLANKSDLELVKQEVSGVKQEVSKLGGIIEGYLKAGLIAIALTLLTGIISVFSIFFTKFISPTSIPAPTPSSQSAPSP